MVNLIPMAVSLYKHVCSLQDYKGEFWQLHYLRTKDGDEVDFCLVHDDRADCMIEAKLTDSSPPSSLKNFRKRYGIKATLVVKELSESKRSAGLPWNLHRII